MGLISDKKMLPLIILAVLWKHSDERHYLTTKELVNRVLGIYQPKEECAYESNKRLIQSYLYDLMAFLEQMQEYGYISLPLRIACIPVAGLKGNNHAYFLEKRPFDDVEVRLLVDSIFFAPGMDDQKARAITGKIAQLASKHFINVHRYVHIGNVVRKTDNSEVITSIRVIGESIEAGRKVSFTYKSVANVVVSPYYLVVYGGRYYCLAYVEDKDTMWHYRVDKISECKELQERAIDINELYERFRLDSYMKMHPRMTNDDVVTVTLNVRDDFIDTVRDEFEIDAEYPSSKSECNLGITRVKVTSCKGALANWLINVPTLAWVEKGDKSGVTEALVERAKRVLEVYG